jgi:hypothetical protein
MDNVEKPSDSEPLWRLENVAHKHNFTYSSQMKNVAKETCWEEIRYSHVFQTPWEIEANVD